MRIELDNVLTVFDKKVVKAKGGTSGYIYIPPQYVDKDVKVVVFNKNNLDIDQKTKKEE